MPHAPEGPFLGETEVPRRSALGPGKGADVLHHARFLVVGLLDEKAVVSDVGGLAGRRKGEEEQDKAVKPEEGVKRET
jgi:hypothetical protein